MKWILILLVNSSGEISVDVVDKYDHMAECYYGMTTRDWDVVTPNKKLVCFPIGGNDEKKSQD